MSSPPTAYTRQADFTGFASTHPDEPPNGPDLDNEFNALKATTDQTRSRLSEIQRDDGALANQIVTPDSLSSNVLAYFTAIGITPRGAWLTATAYAARDIISQAGAVYFCAIAHTAGVFATDLAAGKWQVLSNAAGNQTLNTTSNVQFSSITATGNVTISGTLAVTGAVTFGAGLTAAGTIAGLNLTASARLDIGVASRRVTNHKSNLNVGTAVNFFQINAGTNRCTAIKLKVTSHNLDVQNHYAMHYGETVIMLRDSGGADGTTASTPVGIENSIGDATIFISYAVSWSRSGGVMTIKLAPAITGSAGAALAEIYVEAEAVGEDAQTLVAV